MTTDRPPSAHPNRLIHEKSPYLLQHAHNPVHWYPWGEEAFEQARREDQPIFLSSGYSTCHWCHVMARESFENEEIAALLNRHFVPVKLDREERPDIDRVYMTFVQATTGGGGWPLNVWLTPDLQPFMGGTYFPPEDRGGHPGFGSILTRVAEAWTEDRDRIAAAASDTLARLRAATFSGRAGALPADREPLDRAFALFKSSYDARYGGFGGAPKFPRPSAPDFLLRYYARNRRAGARPADAAAALKMTLHTLRAMAEGGMFDPLGGGFHRYSVDERWRVPHFEKMLYDQAQLVCTYLDAFQITQDPFWARIARETLAYVRRDMTGPEGQFYSAEDADSDNPDRPGEHAEGAFYLWTHAELYALLDSETAAVFSFRHGVRDGGNVRDDPHNEFGGKNILFVAHDLAETAKRFAHSPEEIRRILAEAHAKLFAARAARPRPHRDDKTLTAWNGLMISALARAHQVLDPTSWLTAARNAAAFIHRNLYDAATGRLRRRYRAGEAAIDGYLDDYAFLIRGLLDLYEAGFDLRHLEWAIALQNTQDALFRDMQHGGYFATTGADASVLLRIQDDYDGAEPSANSVAAHNLLRMAWMTDNTAYRKTAENTIQAFSSRLTRAPYAMPAMLNALAFHLGHPRQIVIAGAPDAPDTQALLRAVHSRFVPDKVLVLADGGNGQKTLARHFACIDGLHPRAGKAAAYVCENGACRLPETDPAALAEALGLPAGTGDDFAPSVES